ncbi:putative UPF0368 protein Cxorf26 like protein [Cricetulus griseus]|nr:putative UPF0368 protein Cxorf26 like protein [Cricetulus griseus]
MEKRQTHLHIYRKLTQFLKLTKVDDRIYSEFHENFEKLRCYSQMPNFLELLFDEKTLPGPTVITLASLVGPQP